MKEPKKAPKQPMVIEKDILDYESIRHVPEELQKDFVREILKNI